MNRNDFWIGQNLKSFFGSRSELSWVDVSGGFVSRDRAYMSANK
jgi:hypothetical protein